MNKKSPVIEILFDGDFGNTFHAGENVSGHVHVQTSERIQIRDIRLHVTGMAETYWTERSGDDDVPYSGSEVYMDFKKCLIRSQLPQSFEGSYGHIRYKAKAVIDRPKKKKKDEMEIAFKVLHPLDLNQEPPQLREPLVIHSETPASGRCCVGGFTEINVTLNRGCFVPGETMRFDGEIVNRTNANIKYSKIIIYQRAEYWSTTYENENSSHTYSYTILANFKRPFLRRGHTQSWNNISFVVPQVSSSRLDGCRIINIKYYFEMAFWFDRITTEKVKKFLSEVNRNPIPTAERSRTVSEAGCFKKNTDVSSEIVIGDVPLRDDFQPPAVTSQPMRCPMPYDMSVGYMPPTDVPTLGFDTAGVKAWYHDGKDLPDVHAF